MKDPLFEQLQRRINCNRESMKRAGDIFVSMVDKTVYRQLQFRESFPTDIDELERYLIKNNIYFTQINLDNGPWWKLCTTKILAFLKEDDTPVILENRFYSYEFIHPHTNKKIRIAKHRDYEHILKPEAFTLNYPLPDKPLQLSSMIRLGFRVLSKYDIAVLVMSCLSVVFLNMLTPYFCQIVFNEIIPSSDAANLLPTSIVLLSASLALIVMTLTRSFVVFHLKDKMEYEMQSSLMMRVLNLPTAFHKQFSPGDLSTRVLAASTFSADLEDDTITTILTLLVSALFGVQLFLYGGDIFWLAVVILIVDAIILVLYFNANWKRKMDVNPRKPKVEGFMFNVISGIQKIKTSGAETRAFERWAKMYAMRSSNHIRFPQSLEILGCLQYYYFYVAMLVVMVGAYFYHLSLADYIAFTTAFIIVLNIFEHLGHVTLDLMEASSVKILTQPILESQEENREKSEVVKHVSGEISINKLRFGYPGTDLLILNDFSLHINEGEYVALVGKSGCGKSTLLRLLLGFEKPQGGNIFYGQYNMDDLHKPTLRRCSLSTCLQDGEIFDGTILENICISAPNATEEDAWEAARLAAFDNDIRHMPDGLNTVIGTHGQQVSGGQRQRLLIARALINKPEVLFLDEATSALDNMSQKIVAETFNNLKCTRITIAHRLSTIRYCDRIIFIDQGKVAEDGSYDELVAKGGLFAELVRNQES